MNSEKKTYRDLVNEECEDEVLIQKDITRTYPDLAIFERKNGNCKTDVDPFDYVIYFSKNLFRIY